MSDVSNSLNLEDNNSFKFESYGVTIAVKATRKEHLEEIFVRISKALPENFKIIEKVGVQHTFSITNLDDGIFQFQKNDEEPSRNKSLKVLFDYLESKIRLTVAENAESRVFIHAGVVGWKDKAIVLPANSFQGKTTLVKELIKKGATYYSDEYAVIDENGLAHPFPKTLSLRGIVGKYQQVEFEAESFGAAIGKSPIPVSLILITEFDENSDFKPKILNSGKGILELIPHTLSIRIKPKFTLQVLNMVASRAIICKSLRGEADIVAQEILEFFELNT